MEWPIGYRNFGRPAYNQRMVPQHPRRRPELLVERAGREVMIYSTSQGAADKAGGAIHALNPTAAFIWDLCDGAHSLAEIESALRLAFSVPAERDLGVDVRAAIAEFQMKGLLLG